MLPVLNHVQYRAIKKLKEREIHEGELEDILVSEGGFFRRTSEDFLKFMRVLEKRTYVLRHEGLYSITKKGVEALKTYEDFYTI